LSIVFTKNIDRFLGKILFSRAGFCLV